MAATTKVTVVIKCKWGPQARFSFHVDASIVDPANAVITGAITLLEAITRGKAIHIEISLSAATVASATSAVPYVSEDKMLARFKDENGVGHAYKTFGMIAAILEADKETIDPTNALVLAYTGAVTANALTEAGDAITTFVSAHRVENRKPIKKGRI